MGYAGWRTRFEANKLPEMNFLERHVRTSSGAAAFSVTSNLVLILIKVIAGLAIGSVAILAEAAHSGLDLLAAVVALMSLREAEKPADREHPFGHGKFELLAAAIEALLILGAALFIIAWAAHKMSHGVTLEEVGPGILVMALASGANWLVSAFLFKSARRFHSPALEGDAWHLRTDVYTSLGVMVGLILVKLTGINIIDPLVAIAVAVYILIVSVRLLGKALGDLVDRSLPPTEEETIRKVLEEHAGEFVEFHSLRGRSSGKERHIDLHLVMDRNLSTQKAHDLCEHLEKHIQEEVPFADILIHIEPGENAPPCPVSKVPGA